MATVGFGNYFPATVAGRLFVGIPTILLGMGMLGYATTQVAIFLVRAEALNRKGLAVQRLSGHVLVCTCPSVPRLLRLLDELSADQASSKLPVLLVDAQTEEFDPELARREVHFLRGHPARQETLARAGIEAASRAVVLARDPTLAQSDDLTVATCLTLKNLRPDLHVVAECVDPQNRELITRTGCSSIVCVLDLAPGILA
jgi:voltage-gated potassium channel